ncbi:MAG: K+-sensing histidine kinase KdpD, partial [Oceanospirillaceae bacterium]
MNSEQHIALLLKKVKREKAARVAAEKLLEVKSFELYNAKLLIEESVEKLQNKANLDSERLAYQTKIETMLLSYGRQFLKQAPNAEIIQDLVQSLVDSNSVTACCIHIYPESQIENAGQYDYGRRQHWLPPEQLKQDKHLWDSEEHTYWIALRNSNNILIGFFAARISATGSWLESIKKHMALFSEMLRSAISRQIILANAITARQRAENSEQATRDFLAMINHELRTPLNGLLGTAELLGDSPLNIDQTKLLTTLNHSGELLRAIINDLLDYSKINAGMLVLAEK